MGIAALALLLVSNQSRAADSDWPGFHGLQQAGVVADGQLPNQWSDGDYRWRFDLQTRDVGSMAVQGQNVYLLATSPKAPTIRLISIDLQSGQQRWAREFPNAPNHLHSRNTLASSTPAVDQDHVYVAHGDRDHTWVRCLDHEGNEIWSRDFGTMQSQHGFGTSPVVYEDLLLFNFSQQSDQVKSGQPGSSRVLALDRSTGKTVWETPVTSTRVCYGKPYVHDGKVICANTGDGLYALSLEDGKMLWRLPVFTMRCVSSPIVVGDLAIGTSGSGGGGNHLVAVRMPKSSDDQPQEVYRIERAAPYVPTSVVQGQLMFVIDDKGVASCVDVTTGKVHWTKRIGGNYGASPILVGDKVLLISLEGEATLLKASSEFEKLGSVDLGGPVGATPAYAHGHLLIRIGTELVCL
ncbi:PQQ-binding-like beta-propeller repeat protein [Roseiconus nitratireducens]|uniref:PQQ-binding-like beta-propeller repeat protein n=2 Tax=Roseiconus nitratireducens TaxID=2605748 RepID=A0A5M6D250_9BACT|nr:PQQ-binding-like beta-propeller repeat protein [Roseiconus nitratireducens]